MIGFQLQVAPLELTSCTLSCKRGATTCISDQADLSEEAEASRSLNKDENPNLRENLLRRRQAAFRTGCLSQLNFAKALLFPEREKLESKRQIAS